MTKRRFHAPGYSVSTKGHSVLHRGTYGFTPRRFVGDTISPEFIPRRIYDTSHEEYALGSAVSQATSFSDASLYETYDSASRSRGRDQKLLSDATAAIPPSSTYSPMMATSSRTATARPGRRFLSHPPRIYSPEFDDSPIPSGHSLPTSHLQASAPPRPSVTPTVAKYTRTPSLSQSTSRIASLKGTYDDGLSGVLPERSTRLLGGYIPRSLYHSGSPIGSGTTSPVYRSSYTSLYSPLHKTSYHSGTTSPTYKPSTYTQSTYLLGGYVPPRLAYRTGSISPYRSGTQSPVMSRLKRSRLLAGYVSPRLVSALSPSGSPYASGTQSPVTYTPGLPRSSYESYIVNDPEYPETSYSPRRRPKVLGTKTGVGSYIDRLRRKRAGKQGSSRYWPYYNVEDITSEAGDVTSETGSVSGYYDSGVSHWDDEGAVGGYGDTYDACDTYDNYGDSFNESYMDEPDEYVPFKPRRRLESPGVLELSPFEDTPPAPDLPLVSRVPYVSPLRSNLGSSSTANDLYLNSLVSTSAARARTAFKNNGWNAYDNASLVLSIEGDVVSPSTGGRYGFKYYHPPVPLVGGGLGDSVLSLPSPSTSAVDSFLGTYLNKMRDMRADIRNTLENKYPARPYTSPYKEIGTYTPSKPSDSFLPYTSYRKRLQGGRVQHVDVIELPVSERVLPSETLSLTFPNKSSEHDKDKRDYFKLTVLDKIKIKAAIVASKVELEPRRKRPRSKFAAEKLRATRVPGELAVKQTFIHSSTGKALSLDQYFSPARRITYESVYYKPTAYYVPPRSIGSSHKLTKRFKRSQIKRSRIFEESIYDGHTSGLQASRPPLRYDDYTGMYRLEARTDPSDVMYKPGSFGRMRAQVRDAHDKLDRHRQMLDRYLVDSGPAYDVQGSVQRKMEELERRDPTYRSSRQPAMPTKQPVSDLRRRLRRTVCKSRGDPNYYRDRE